MRAGRNSSPTFASDLPADDRNEKATVVNTGLSIANFSALFRHRPSPKYFLRVLPRKKPGTPEIMRQQSLVLSPEILMSRSGKRLERFTEVDRHRRAEARQPQKPWTWRDKASVWGSLAAVGIFALIPFAGQSIQYHRSIDERLGHWKADYHLTDHTVEKLRVIELRFHDFESPLSIARQPSALETAAHQQEIAGHLAPEDARIFLERDTAKHTR